MVNLVLLLLILCVQSSKQSEELNSILKEASVSPALGWLLSEIVIREGASISCVCVLTDPHYSPVLHHKFFLSIQYIPVLIVKVKESEDLLAPNYQTVKTMQQVRQEKCNFYIILLANGNQAVRLLRFGDKYRLVDSRARFLLLYSPLLFESGVLYLWSKIINVIFIHRLPNSSRYELSTVPFPALMQSNVTLDWINSWRNGYFRSGVELFPEKTNNMKGFPVKVAIFSHIPSTVKQKIMSGNLNDEVEKFYFSGLEVEIVKSLGDVMKFEPMFYEVADGAQWGQRQLNGSFSGLFGELMVGHAQLGLGTLQHTLYTLDLVDLSRPFMSICLTFLTPQSSTDNSWTALLLPFMLNLWIAILISLSLGGLIFFILAQFQQYIAKLQRKKSLSFKTFQQEGLFVFEKLQSSVLYTYGMLLSVSLPTVPKGWALRIMTGWWWFYCLLLVVSYRASLTAILAKPQPVVTIDTIQELVTSPVQCAGWGEPEKLFFTTSFDPDIHKIGAKFETIQDVDKAVSRVAAGTLAYYENEFFLLDTIVQYSNKTSHITHGEQQKQYKLHIMEDCIISMPVSIGLTKNSPLKPRVDKFVQRVVEAGLVNKWLSDIMADSRRRHDAYRTVQVKALMDTSKFSGALVALGIGYIFCILALVAELLYWHIVIKRDPLFDKYSMQQFYSCKKLKS